MSDIVQDITGRDRSLEQMAEDVHQMARRSSSGGGDGMEPRIARLEAHTDHLLKGTEELKADMRNVRDRLAAIEVRVDHLPSKGFIVTVVLAALAVIGAMIGFQESLQSLLGS
jgi:hypothetical protein